MNQREYFLSYRAYQRDPDAFDEDQISALANYAEKNQVQFEYANTSASIGSLANNLFDGFIQGFTTLPVGDKPTNDIDGIAHSIGHLMGFIGIIPGLGTGVSMATKAGVKGASTVGRVLSKSVPMRVADMAMNQAAKTGIKDSVSNAVGSVFGARAGFARQAIRHGAHLGVASQVSSVWDDMKDENIPGFLANTFMTGVQGGIFGATFAGIGNIKLPGNLAKTKYGPITGEQVVKGIAGSLAQATPMALSGASTPENVYNALLGAYFGGKAKPWAYEKAAKNPDLNTNEVGFEFYKESSAFKNKSKVERDAEIEVFNTLKNPKDPSTVIQTLMEQFGAPIEQAPQTMATVRSSSRKYAGEQVEVLSSRDDAKMVKIRVGESEPVSIRKEDLRFEDEGGVESLTKKIKSDPASDVEALDVSPGDAATEIPIVRPVENFLRKIHKIGEKETLDAERYEKNLNDLNKIVYDRIEQAKEANELFVIDRAVTDKNRIGNIRTRDPLTTKSKGVGTRIVNAIKNEFIGKHSKDLDKSYIEISPSIGTKEKNYRDNSVGFWEKMGFEPTGEFGADGRALYRYDLKPEIQAFEAKNKGNLVNAKRLKKLQAAEEINKITEEQSAPAWNTVKQEILSTFKKYDVNESDVAEIRNYYRRRTEAIQIPRFALHGNKLVQEEQYDFNNNRVTDYEPMKLINRIAMDNGLVDKPSDAYFVVKNTIVSKKGRNVQKNIGQEPFKKTDYRKVVSLANQKGYYPYSGKSDSPVLIFVKKNLGEKPAAERSRITKEFTEIDPNFKKEYRQLQKQAFEEGGIRPTDFADMFVSNVRWWESLNGGVKLKDIASGEGYLKDVMTFNKRQQPLFSDYYPLTTDTFNKNFRYVTVNDLKNSNDPTTKKLLKWMTEHDDGGALVRMDKLDLMVQDMGLPENSGFAKPFFTSNQEQNGKQLGTLIGKLAFHGAGPKLTQAMKEAGIDFIVPRSVAKQYGSRQLIDYSFKDGKMGFSLNGKSVNPKESGYVYEMKPEDIAVSWGVKDGSSYKINDPVRVYKQIQEQFMNYDVQTVGKANGVDINGAMKKFIQEKFEGDPVLNKELNRYIKSGKSDEAALKNISNSFERLGAKEIVEAMKDMTKSGESFRELVRRKIQRLSEEGMEKRGVESETDWEGSFIKEKMTSAQALLENGGTKDAVALSKDLAPLLDRSMTRYFLKRILQPEVIGSKFIMRMYDLELAQRTDKMGNTSRLKDEKDLFFLDDNAKTKKMNVLDTNGRIQYGKTLLDQWNAYLKEPDGTVLKGRMEERMRSVAVRTPIDSVSGLADLKFGGFTGIKGGGILLHPETMKRLGGADLDIDAAMIYTAESLPKEFHEIGRLFKDDFSNVMKYADKKYGGYDNVVKKFIVEDNIVGRKSLTGMFDPFLRLKTATTIQNAGEVMRGIAVNSKTQMRMFYNAARQKPGNKFTHFTEDGHKIEFVAKKDEMDLKLHGMAAVTVSVDVANYGALRSPEFLKKTLFKSGFESLHVTPKGGKRTKLNDKGIEEFFNPYSKEINYIDSPIGEFANTVNKFFGKNRETGLSWERSDVITAAENHPKWDTGIYSMLSKSIKQLDYSDSMFERLQYNTDRLRDFSRIMREVVKSNPEITRYVKGDYKSTPITEISKRMDLLSTTYTTDKLSLAYDAPYNLATGSGIQRMANNFSVFDAFIKKHTLKDRKGKEYNFITKNKDYNAERLKKSPVSREIYLKKYIKQVNDFMSNDLRDLASLKTINDTGALHNIKADSELPRPSPRNPNGLTSLNKWMMDRATEAKKEFSRVYREAKGELDVSPNSTALDSISRFLNGDQPSSIKSRLVTASEVLNRYKRESDPDVTYEGLREYFDSLLLGSINRGNKTESLYFVPQLVSKNVLNRFNENMQSIFVSRQEKPTYEQVEKMFSRDETDIILTRAQKLDLELQEIEFLKPKVPISELPADMQNSYKRIEGLLKSLQETAGMNPESMQKFIASFFANRGKADFSAINKYELLGFEAFMKDIVRGGGVFSWFTRGKGSKHAGFWKEVDEKGFTKNARGFWFKPAETVAFEHLKNDVELINVEARAFKWVKQKDPDNPGKFKMVKEFGKYKSWVPQSHFQQIIDSTYGMSEYNAGMRILIEERFQNTMGVREVRGTNSKTNKMDDLVDIAWREIEAASSIIKTKEGLRVVKDEADGQSPRDAIKFKKRLEDGFERYEGLLKEKYNFTIKDKTANYEAREVIDVLKRRMQKVVRDTYTESVKIQPDFYNMLDKVIKKQGGRKTVKTSQGRIDVTEIPITSFVKNVIDKYLKPGAVVKRKEDGGRHWSLEEVNGIGKATDIKIHVEDSYDPITKKWKLEEYNRDQARNLKDVYSFKDKQEMFKDSEGKRPSLFDFFKNPSGKVFKEESGRRYLNNLLLMFKPDKLTVGWQKRWEDIWDQISRSPRGVSERAFLFNESYVAYKKYVKENPDYSPDQIGKHLSIVRSYFLKNNDPTKGGFVAWKRPYSNNLEKGEPYSQYLHDVALAEGSIKMPLYLRQKLTHSSLTGFQPIGDLGATYMPHLNPDVPTANKEAIKFVEEAARTTNSPKEFEKIRDEILNRKNNFIQNSKKEDQGLADQARDSLLFRDLGGERGVRNLQSLGGGSKPGNMLKRSQNFDGYSRHFSEMGNYAQTIQAAIATEVSSVKAKLHIRNFKKKKPMGKHTKDWEDYMRIFARDVLGAPSTLSKEMLDSTTLNIKSTPWWYTSDEYLYSKKSVYKLVDKLSGRSKPTAFVKEIYNKRYQNLDTNGQMELFNPKDAKRETFEQWWGKQQELFGVRYDAEGRPIEENMNFFSGKMREYSQVEGKYQLATLLARMKVVVNNVFGGGTNAWVYNGARPMRDARKIETWQSIDPRFKSMRDVDDWLGKLGVVEEMLRYDLGYLGAKREGNWQAFSKDVASLAMEKYQNKGKDSLYDTRFRDLVSRHSIGSKGMEIAAMFMGRSELFLRMNTFKAGYIAIRESMSPVQYELNDPYLIQQAKKSVKASQFLYSAPFRPSFARSSAGKIYSRFKLWAWNSVKFKKEIYKDAKYAGFKPGSAEAKRLERMAIADLFMIGMAKLLPYTMFDYSLPAPYSYFQDTADWMFGSDQQRERAFYGALPRAIAPLHEFMPSFLRGPEAAFGNLWSGNWDRFADYTLVSHFPFGMLTRDIVGAVQSPALLGEFVTGLPLHRLGRLKQDIMEDKKASGYSPGFY